VAYFIGRAEESKKTFTEKMKHKIDSTAGRAIYSMRLAVSPLPTFDQLSGWIILPCEPNPR
jgi:hypothetical protein